jgi:hypothetical protein
MALPWCWPCSSTLEEHEVGLDGRNGTVQAVAGRFLDMWNGHCAELVWDLFTPDALMRYPGEGITVAGAGSIARQYGLTFQLRPTLALDRMFSDNGKVWALYTVTIPCTLYTVTILRRLASEGLPSPGQGPEWYVARLELACDQVTAMDVYSIPVADSDSQTRMNGASRRDVVAQSTSPDQDGRPVDGDAKPFLGYNARSKKRFSYIPTP